MALTNPFAVWAVEDRYEDGSQVGEQRAADHISAAEAIVRIVQQAQLSGVAVA